MYIDLLVTTRLRPAYQKGSGVLAHTPPVHVDAWAEENRLQVQPPTTCTAAKVDLVLNTN